MDKYSEIYKEQVDILEERFNKLLVNEEPASLYDPCKYIITSGGKRLRPYMVLLSSKAAGGNFEDAYNAAVAVELLHNFTLVHDDIMDKADKRRGRETVHIKFGLNPAILAGDNLVAVAYRNLLKDCRINTAEIMDSFTTGLIEVCEGQSYDTDFETQENVTIDQYKLMIQKKTAAMVEMCCAVGGYLANADEKIIKALKTFGLNLGMAFQIQDDLLDILADEAKFGKVVGGDLVEGKKTYIFLKALEFAEGDDKKLLLEVVKNKGIDKSMVPMYRNLYIKLGVIEDARSLMNDYNDIALKALDVLPDTEAKENLIWLANMLIKRSK